MIPRMDTRWLRVLVDLADLGTLRAVAAATGYSTSAVSQHLARLQNELGLTLVEPIGRRLALTPAGQALLPHARNALTELEAARGELDSIGPLRGVIRVAGYATAVLRHITPAVGALRQQHPDLDIRIEEREPDEIRTLLAQDAIDVGIVYDHSLVPRPGLGRPYATARMLLAVHPADKRPWRDVVADVDTVWIANSRASDDDEVIHHVTASAGVAPRIHHHIDSIELVTQLVADNHGTALVAADATRHPAVRYLDLDGAAGDRRSYTTTRPGREHWPLIRTFVETVGGTTPQDGHQPWRE